MELATLSKDQFLARLKNLAAEERRCVADIVACMAEIDRRHALDGTVYPSLFDPCVKELRMTEDTAYRRVRAVRVAAQRPEVFALLREGSVNPTTLSMIESHLAADPGLLGKIIGKNRREVERILAQRAPATAHAPRDSIRLIRVCVPSEEAPGADRESFFRVQLDWRGDHLAWAPSAFVSGRARARHQGRYPHHRLAAVRNGGRETPRSAVAQVPRWPDGRRSARGGQRLPIASRPRSRASTGGQQGYKRAVASAARGG